MNLDNSPCSSNIPPMLPKIDESDSLASKKPPKERIFEFLDVLEIHVEQLRKNATQLEENKDGLLVALDSVLQADLTRNLSETEFEDVHRYSNRIINRCLTIDIKVLTQRDKMQEDALYQVNHLIDNLVVGMKADAESAQSKCESYMNACSSSGIGFVDKNFESALLGCTLDDQKKVKRRLQGLLNYFEKMKVVPYQ